MNNVSLYPSKVDVWLAVVLIAAPLISIGMGVYLLSISSTGGWLSVIIGLCVAAVLALFAIPCRYMLTANSLIIQAGILKEEIPFDRIKEATLSSNPLSAPALSLKRVKIVLDKGFRLISPNDRERFITELEAKMKMR
jgi:membrane protein YdbS with pleckstrin-like domain